MTVARGVIESKDPPDNFEDAIRLGIVSSQFKAVFLISCSYCCGDLLIADDEQEVCQYCGNPPILFSRFAANGVPKKE